MGKKERQARRAKRRENRKTRREELERLLKAIRDAKITFKPDDEGPEPPFIDVFNQIWPVLDPALKFSIASGLTGARADEHLEEIHRAGVLLSTGGGAEQENQFRDKFRNAWGILELALQVMQLLTPDNVDDVLDDVIEVGDWIAGE